MLVGRVSPRVAGMVVVLATISLGCLAAPALAAGPWWHLTSGSRPSYLEPEGKGQIVATLANLGDAPASGEVTITDTLPKELTATTISAELLEGSSGKSAKTVVCVLGTLTCTFNAGAEPYDQIEVHIGVKVREGAAICEPNSALCESNEVSVTGGGAPSARISRPVTVSEQPIPFGIEAYEITPEEEGGAPATQAGSHPFQVTGTLTMNQLSSGFGVATGHIEAHPVALAKDLAGLLPPGLIGNPTPFPQCTLSDFKAEEKCPPRSVVGVADIIFNEPRLLGLTAIKAPIVNLEPAHGEGARFGFLLTGATPVYLDAHVRTSGDYGVTLSSSNLTQFAAFIGYKLTFWGVPGDPRHDPTRGSKCLHEFGACPPLGETTPPPFLAMPTSCNGPLHTSTEGDSYLEPKPEGARLVFAETEPMPAMHGCNRLPFEPQIKITPDGTEASTSTGLTADVHVPQEAILNGKSLAQSAVRGITVALPEGVAVDPAGGDGLQACSESLVGFQGFKEFETNPGVSTAAFSPTLPEPFCPTASKIGTAEISSPLLPKSQHLKGAVYLATQNENPFGSLIALYVVVEDPISGTLVRLPGETRLTESGQLIATFKNNPQLAFEDAELHFFGGERAPLATPARCGAYTTTASFVPWSAEPWDEAAVTVPASSTFNITSGPHGTPCPGASLPFSPTLTGGATNINAGAFSPLTGTFGREDGEQQMAQLQFHLPPGLSGLLSSVKLCGEAQANEGSCGPESLIGETIVSAGVGSDPISVRGGRVYITGPYHGAPFGLSVVNPVKAGPFDLEHDTANPAQNPACDCIVVRAKIAVDPITAALTITSNSEAEGYAIPHLIDGIPVQIKRVNFTTTRSGFQFNPTNCDPTKITGTVTSDEGVSHAVEVPFQVTNCAVLKFEPKFSASTSGKTSRSKGASLTLKVTRPTGPGSGQANFTLAKIELPKQLPARLTTLQKACTAAQFNANPAGCPAESDIGHVKVITPLLPVPLEGPAYFVSHGGEAFPSVIFVLQGYGVTIDVVSTTFISKSGITSATIKTVPDAPFTSFELTFPEKQYSALAANGNLCKSQSKLKMPTEFLAQNGLKINESTKISVTGCAKAKKVKKHKKGKTRGKGNIKGRK
jgi:hypothetical protein